MIELLEQLCSLDGTSGDENTVREKIISLIGGYCEYSVDNLGNIIAFKKGKKESKRKIMIDAHMDEVGLIITNVTPEGFLRFSVVGGIDTAVLLCRRVLINGKVAGVIGAKPIHLAHDGEAEKLPKKESLYIDIGAGSAEQALKHVSLGDRAVLCGEFVQSGNKILSKALDDRIGCAILINLIREEAEYDFYAVFSVQEEVGLRGAKTATFSLMPDSAIILEGTTAADIADVGREKRVCSLTAGAVVSFMDRATVYDRTYYNAALKSGIKVQAKCAVAGGNNSGAVHLTGKGVRTVSISAPCRYIHCASSVADINDINDCLALARYMLKFIAEEK